MDKYDKITNITVLQLYMFVYLFLEQHVSVLICVQIRVHSFVYTVHYVISSTKLLESKFIGSGNNHFATIMLVEICLEYPIVILVFRGLKHNNEVLHK